MQSCNWFSNAKPVYIMHWGSMTHIYIYICMCLCVWVCVSANKENIYSHNPLLLVRRQAIIWINAGLFFIRALLAAFRWIGNKIQFFSPANAFGYIVREKQTLCIDQNMLNRWGTVKKVGISFMDYQVHLLFNVLIFAVTWCNKSRQW